MNLLGDLISAVIKKLIGPTFEVDDEALQTAIDDAARSMGLL
jgi:hypothetical protein